MFFKYWNSCKRIIIKNWPIILLFLFYLLFHLFNLTNLPPYNDESIYLDWGWFNTHAPDHLYDSLIDSKQPLMIWLFGISENFFTDPVFAGRFVSVLFGAFSMLGIYASTKELLNKKSAIIASLLFLFTPIFVFYNRQALMEAGILCMGIWSFYGLLKLIKNPTTKNGVILGIFLGIGFFIKTSILLFVISSAVIVLFFVIKKNKKKIIKPYLYSLLTIFIINVLLFINPVFWQTLSSNSRYAYTASELLGFPILSWTDHIFGSIEIGAFFLSPSVFIFGILGIIIGFKNKIKDWNIYVMYFLIAFVLEVFSVRTQNQRYIVPFLSFFVIGTSYVFYLLWQGNLIKKIIVLLLFSIPFILSIILVVNPEKYIIEMSKFSKYSNMEHIRGQMSGYGINEAMQFIRDNSDKSGPNLVLFALNAGNPENAIDVYSAKDPNLYALHIDSSFFPDLDNYKCFTSDYSVFFVTRYDQRVGLDRYFTLQKSFLNPDGKFVIGIYGLKKDCKGNSLSLSDVYKGSMDRINQLR